MPAVTSALQRARATVAGRLPGRSQQAALPALGDERTRALAGRYADAIERGDTNLLVSMLTRDATRTMPPERARLCGLEAIREFLRTAADFARFGLPAALPLLNRTNKTDRDLVVSSRDSSSGSQVSGNAIDDG